jgi:hypothetical protein
MGKSNRGSDLTCAGCGRCSQNPRYEVFSAGGDLTSAPPYRAAPIAAVVLLAVGVELHSLLLDESPRPQERWSTPRERPSQAPLPGCSPPTPRPASHR